MKTFLLHMCAFILVSSQLAFGEDQQAVPEAIKTLIERPLQINAGVFKFRRSRGTFLQEEGRLERDPDIPPSTFTVAVEGADWLRRSPGSRNMAMSRYGISAIYYEIEQGGVLVNQRLTLGKHEGPLEFDTTNSVWKMCRRMGAIPVQSVSDYVAKTPPTSESETVIDGVRCRVFDYALPTKPKMALFKVLHALHHSLFDQETVTLRLCVAEEYGCALARMEVIGPLGSYSVTEAGDFVEVASDVFLPRKWKKTYGPETGVEKNVVYEFELLEFAHVNENLPDDTFAYEIPAGTSVTDHRPGLPRRQHDVDKPTRLSVFLEEN